jgi:hypothetical protein
MTYFKKKKKFHNSEELFINLFKTKLILPKCLKIKHYAFSEIFLNLLCKSKNT